MKIYTTTGDEGMTGLFGGQRVLKDHPRVEAYGAVDELNAVIGQAAAALDPGDEELRATLEGLQGRLLGLGADLATPSGGKSGHWVRRASEAWVRALEEDIDTRQAVLPALDQFVLPGGHPAAAALHLARTVCRRAERRVVAARAAGEEINPQAAIYLNRLSDWLFVAARHVNHRNDVPEATWAPAADDEG